MCTAGSTPRLGAGRTHVRCERSLGLKMVGSVLGPTPQFDRRNSWGVLPGFAVLHVLLWPAPQFPGFSSLARDASLERVVLPTGLGSTPGPHAAYINTAPNHSKQQLIAALLTTFSRLLAQGIMRQQWDSSLRHGTRTERGIVGHGSGLRVAGSCRSQFA